MARMQSQTRQALSPLIRGSFVLFGGYVLRILVQAGYFVVVTRGLGAADFGRYTSVQALLLGLVAFTAAGYPVLAVREVSRVPEARARIWSDGVRITTLFGGLVVVGITLFGPVVLSIEFPRLPLFLFGASEVVFTGFLLIFTGIQQGEQRLRRMAVIEVGLAAARTLLVGAVWWITGLTLLSFALAHTAATALWLGLVLGRYGRSWAWPLRSFDAQAVRRRFRDGLSISVSNSGRSFLLGLDKMLLPALVGAEVAGQYAAAFRLVAFALLPIQAFMSALYPRFFAEGARSTLGVIRLWRRAAPWTIAYAIPIALLVWLAAPLLRPVLGMEFPDAPVVLRSLIGVIVIQALYLPLGDALAGADSFGFRSLSILAALIANLIINLLLIPEMGWRGAVVAVYVSHAFLLLLYAWGVNRKARAGHEIKGAAT